MRNIKILVRTTISEKKLYRCMHYLPLTTKFFYLGYKHHFLKHTSMNVQKKENEITYTIM